MTLAEILLYLFTWGLVGIIAFNLYVVIVFRTGIVYNTRKTDGTMKEKQDLSGILSSLSILVLILFLQIVSNYFLLVVQGFELSFLGLLLLNYALYLLLFLYDTFVIDYIVIGKWRPGFLLLPEEMNAESMAVHIRISLVVGPILGLGIILIGVLISYYLFA